MEEDLIANIIKQKLKEGVSDKEVSEYLSAAGYSLYDIDRLMTKAKMSLEKNPSTPLKKILMKQKMKKTQEYIFIAGFAFLVFISLAFLVIHFSNQQQANSNLIVLQQGTVSNLGNLSSPKKLLFLGDGKADFNVINQRHSVSIVKIVDDEVYLKVSSKSMVFGFKQGESKKIDVNSDDVADIEVTLVSLSKENPLFSVEKIKNTKVAPDAPDYLLNESSEQQGNSNSNQQQVSLPSGACSDEGKEIDVKCVDDSHLKYALCFNGEWIVNIKSCPQPTFRIKNGFTKAVCENKECKVIQGCNDNFVFVNSSEGEGFKKMSYCCNKTEDNETICNDGLDNDCDGLIDVSDFDCSWFCEGNQTKPCVLPDNLTGVMNCVNGSWSNCTEINVTNDTIVFPLLNERSNTNFSINVGQNATLLDCDNLTLLSAGFKNNSKSLLSLFDLTNNSGFYVPGLGGTKGTSISFNLHDWDYPSNIWFTLKLFSLIQNDSGNSTIISYNCSDTECSPGENISCITSDGCPGVETCGSNGFYGECVDVPDDGCPDEGVNPPPSNGLN